jgi:hypothetical protein
LLVLLSRDGAFTHNIERRKDSFQVVRSKQL